MVRAKNGVVCRYRNADPRGVVTRTIGAALKRSLLGTDRWDDVDPGLRSPFAERQLRVAVRLTGRAPGARGP
jgi:hypothetical protein